MMKSATPFLRGSGFLFFSHTPSLRARKLWSYVLGVGCARCRPREQTESAANRPGYLLHYLLTGEVEHTVKGQRFLLRPGYACLLDRSQKHRLRTTSSRSARLWWVFFNGGPELSRMYTELGAELDHVFPLVARERFEKSFRELWQLTVHPSDSSEVQSHVLLQQVITELFLARADKLRVESLIPNKTSLSEPVCLAITTMEQRYHWHDVTLKTLAEVAGLSLYHFVHKFHAECGMSPMQYLYWFRIEQAKFLLRTTNKSIREVAPLVGMRDANYFTRYFRKLSGMTPKQYRRSLTSGGNNSRDPS